MSPSAHPRSRIKWMLVLSVMFHIALGLASMAASSYRPSRFLEPVTVVDLIGGGIPQSPTKTVAPQDAPPLAPKTKAPPSEPAGKDDLPVKKAKEKQAKKEKQEKEPKAPAKNKKPEIDLNALASVSERLQKMREERDRDNAARKAIEERRNAAAAREAVRGVGERAVHRIEGPTVRDMSSGSGGGYGGGSRGTVRVSPEMMEFFSRLEERVRESWILPEALVRDASGLMVEVRITIEKDGRVSDTRIEKGSGNVYFDESVRRAIRKASPLPIPPERLRGGEDHYEVGFRFHGTGGKG
ncbi:MAG: TonB C-terminal domain-containing protein [Syntrophorhabdaceae bacterium]|nr:TonB C-terminal domain-containing protein [Syntrophorhabdaceae bacterium]